jgi:4-amino-4-deoxy-L-arabinose transferase-like glycosyltransferase
LLGLFCALAGLRILFYAAAFPFFNNVDEYDHFDLVCKYAGGHVPRGLETWSDEAAGFVALYGSPEFIGRVQDFPAGKTPSPVWACPPNAAAKAFQRLKSEWIREKNYEAVQPPFYYVVVGAWFDAGKLIGIGGGNLLYWTRLVNVLAYVLLVWLSYVFTKELFPACKFLYLGVPLVLVVLPQSVFYGLNNDVLSAPLVTLSLYLLFRLYRSDAPSRELAVGAGLSTAAAFLTKYTNAPLLVVPAVVAVLKLKPWSWRKPSRTELIPVVLLLLASAIPIGCWLARNYLVLGELTGFALKGRHMDWTPKSVGQYWDHPIFTFQGCVCFTSELASTLWRGEILWRRKELAAAGMDTFYAWSSAVFLLAFVVASFARVRKSPRKVCLAAMLCLLMVALYVALLIFLSISFDFGSGVFGRPSRAWPYFANGRMMLGALVPFLIMYLGGLVVLLGWLRASFLRLPLLILTVDVIALSEIGYSLDVFASQYNWYHLP